MIKIKNGLLNLVILAGYSIPIIILLLFVIKFSVNGFYWDDIILIEFFSKFRNGNVQLHDLFEQYGEHRLLFPKIILTFLAFISNWNVKFITLINAIIAIINCIIVYLISKRTNIDHQINKFNFHLTNIITFCLILSFAQYENWLFGFQIAWFLIQLCISLSVFILISSIDKQKKYFILMLICFFSSFCSAHGIVIWLSITPVLFFNNLCETKSGKIKLFLGWLMLFIFCLLLYLFNFQKPSKATNPDTFFFLKHPIKSIYYFCVSIGSPIGVSINISFMVGIFIGTIFLLFNLYFFKNYWQMMIINQRKNNTVSSSILNLTHWLSIGWFGFIFNVLTTMGRSAHGIEQAMTSRYTTPTILLLVSCVQIISIFCNENSLKLFKYLKLIVLFLVSISMVLFIVKTNNSITYAQGNMLNRIRGKICLELIFYLKNPERYPNCLQAIHPDPKLVISMVKPLEDLGFRSFPKNIIFVNQPQVFHGDINLPRSNDTISAVHQNDNLYISGWAIIPNRQQQPQMVFFSYGDEKTFFGDALIHIPRTDVVEAFKSKNYAYSGWEASISLKSLPIGDNIIKAWVYDQQAQKFIRLGGEPKIRIVE